MKKKSIISLEIYNSSYGPFHESEITAHRLSILRTGVIKHILYRGFSELPAQEYEYPADEKKIDAFFELLVHKVEIQKWNTDYSVVVFDGYHWECTIEFSNNSTKKVFGTVESPPNGEMLKQQIYQLVDYKIKPWIF